VPVDGTKLNFVELVVAGKLPVVVDTIVGYQVELELVLSVIAILVAFVEFVAVVAELAFPVNAPTKVVEVTLVSPAIVVSVPPKLTADDPIVTLELFSAEFGIDVKFAPEPLNPVAVKMPVEGLYWSLVELVYSVARLPLVWFANKG
jgi:hypothetical protein